MKEKKHWRDLSESQKVGVLFLGTLQVALLAAALWDIRQRPADEIKGSRRMWTALVFINFAGPIAYFLIGRKR